MKIIHLSAEKSWRGGEQQIAYLLQGLEKLGCKQLVVCRRNSAFEKYCVDQNIPHKSLAFRNQFDIVSSLALKKISREFEADIIHIHSSHAHAIAVWAYYLGNKTKMILARKVDFPISSNFLSKLKYNCNGIAKIICVSKAIQQVMNSGIKDPRKLTVVYDGIELASIKSNSDTLRKEFNVPQDELIIANTSALAEHKDYPCYLKFVNLARKHIKARFFIIGDGPMHEEIKLLAENMNLSHDLVFTGFRTDIKKILSEVDYFIMTSKTEGLGSSILDAYHHEVPVIATAAGGIPEIVIDQNTGMLVPVGDYKGVFDALQILINDGHFRNSLVQNAKKFVQSFDISSLSEKTMQVYLEAVDVK